MKELQDGETMIDSGCCLGQNLRRAAYDAAPAKNVVGSDLKPVLMDMCYEMFKDGGTFQSKSYHCDIFKLSTDTKASGALSELEGHFDIVLCSEVLHLWSQDVQI
ncbi:hypothetical protein BAUCODRAFT_123666 [Baudoinia panamericana UAMH 10762]|uniref:Methyltransferase type 11 domain-containing protein n=1 Tax=Baudoinia panamericana (strain UAMH 10762) TaxID=717646 RepID=M2MUF2_BAUPA|nr:uncharacterized protein BAUCODRAFT_123666 [Baudoinia panamericana UAMH 10762]EMC95198.1 hypothetical protein BAUCODRAFT_123666 [Baudoinia panamericana UAMH 10762]